MELRNKSYSPTSEDLLLSIELEKKELLRLKKDLEAYKSNHRRLRNRQLRIVDGQGPPPEPTSKSHQLMNFTPTASTLPLPTSITFEDTPSRELQYITLPKADGESFMPADQGFLFRKSVAVDYSHTDLKLGAPKEFALSESCSPQLALPLESVDDIIFEDLSEAIGFTSLKGRLEGTDGYDKAEGTSTISGCADRHLKLSFSPETFNSTSTLDVNPPLNSKKASFTSTAAISLPHLLTLLKPVMRKILSGVTDQSASALPDKDGGEAAEAKGDNFELGYIGIPDKLFNTFGQLFGPDDRATKLMTSCRSDAQPSPIMEEASEYSSHSSPAAHKSTPCPVHISSDSNPHISPMDKFHPPPVHSSTDAEHLDAFSHSGSIFPESSSVERSPEPLKEEGQMTITPRRLKERLSYLPKVDKSSLLSDVLNIFDRASLGLDSDPASSKALPELEQKPLRASFSDPTLKRMSAHATPRRVASSLKLELVPSLDLNLTDTVDPKLSAPSFFSPTSALTREPNPDRNGGDPRTPLLKRLWKLVRPTARECRLYQFDDTSADTLVASGPEISAKLLHSRNAYVLECEKTLFLWFGRQATDAKQRDASRFAGSLIRDLRTHLKLTSSPTIRRLHLKVSRLGEADNPKENPVELAIHHNTLGWRRLEEVYSRPYLEPLGDLDNCQRVSLKVWLMRGNHDHLELSVSEHGLFYASESYVMLYHYRDSNRKDRHAVFYWVGRTSKRAKEPILPPSEVALDDHHEALMVQVLQGREPSVFMSLFGGLVVVRWGTRRPPPADKELFHVCGTSALNVKAEQTTCAPKYLCSGHSFVLVTKGRLYVWHGIGSFLFERLAAVQVAKRLGGVDARVVEVREKLEPRKFWSHFGREPTGYADALQWARKPFLHSQYSVRLFRLADSSVGVAVDEVRPFHQGDLDLSQAFLLDTYFDLFLWCRFEGRVGTRQPTLLMCLNLCMEYTRLIEARETRPFKLKPILSATRVHPSHPGGAPSHLKPSTLKRKASTRALPVEYLLTKFLPQQQTHPAHTSQASTLETASKPNRSATGFTRSLRKASRFATKLSSS
ncbi:hypothetical protein L0F63_003728 [Massospora cicadina]|nr:hypothetical protein L0F63_003728 [Massospora cicadina]